MYFEIPYVNVNESAQSGFNMVDAITGHYGEPKYTWSKNNNNSMVYMAGIANSEDFINVFGQQYLTNTNNFILWTSTNMGRILWRNSQNSSYTKREFTSFSVIEYLGNRYYASAGGYYGTNATKYYLQAQNNKYSSLAAWLADVSPSSLYPITYSYTNSIVSGPSEAAVGETVIVSAVPDVGYGIIDASTQIIVTNDDVAVPYTWDATNQRITFTMPQPAENRGGFGSTGQ